MHRSSHMSARLCLVLVWPMPCVHLKAAPRGSLVIYAVPNGAPGETRGTGSFPAIGLGSQQNCPQQERGRPKETVLRQAWILAFLWEMCKYLILFRRRERRMARWVMSVNKVKCENCGHYNDIRTNRHECEQLAFLSTVCRWKRSFLLAFFSHFTSLIFPISHLGSLH